MCVIANGWRKEWNSPCACSCRFWTLWLSVYRATIIIISHLVRCSSECHNCMVFSWRNNIDLTGHTREDTKMKSGQDDKIRWSTHATTTTTAAAISSSRHLVQGRTYISFNCNQWKNTNTHEQINTSKAAAMAASVHYYCYCCIIGWFSAFLASLYDARGLHNLSIPFLFFLMPCTGIVSLANA